MHVRSIPLKVETFVRRVTGSMRARFHVSGSTNLIPHVTRSVREMAIGVPDRQIGHRPTMTTADKNLRDR
jgi:hypothetical protein